ncbi:MAG: Hsp20/alpha crystallin family protein [Candidatus Krumholzibacteriota bacterium]|nr:Hsp20/alpha crystallin family protein [Candidatus Krumholzibacteriota bacterium]
MGSRNEDLIKRLANAFISGETEGKKMKFHADLSWEPSVDVIETKKDIIVIVDIAGMKGEDINVVTDGKILKISGRREGVFNPEQKQFHKLEIEVGCFARKIELPVSVDRENRSACYENGLLKIILKKTPDKDDVRKIEID